MRRAPSARDRLAFGIFFRHNNIIAHEPTYYLWRGERASKPDCHAQYRIMRTSRFYYYYYYHHRIWRVPRVPPSRGNRLGVCRATDLRATNAAVAAPSKEPCDQLESFLSFLQNSHAALRTQVLIQTHPYRYAYVYWYNRRCYYIIYHCIDMVYIMSESHGVIPLLSQTWSRIY